ncbi:hypothetical protein BDQ17DRAFT_1328556 [Cyathus striatus]|nr:hypothetical protein BDQ17DRAFT_1328556 [Cyathus striatus]
MFSSLMKQLQHLMLPCTFLSSKPSGAGTVEKTTIVITHDLSQIDKGDFMYVMKSGHIIKYGYCRDLEAASSFSSLALSLSLNLDQDKSKFKKMLTSQQHTSDFVPREVGEDVLINWEGESKGNSEDEETVPSKLKTRTSPFVILPLATGYSIVFSMIDLLVEVLTSVFQLLLYVGVEE